MLLIALAAAPLLLGGAESARAERHGDGAASSAAYDRRVLLELPNGDIEELETEYARIFIRKFGSYLTMSFRLRGGHHLQSIANLEHPQELPAPYTQVLTAAVLYAARTRSLLMLGMGAGTTSRYLWRHIPGLSVQAVELDPGVIALAKKYFGARAAKGYRIQRGDARVFLKRNPQPHDMILVDAYRSDRVPFHLATREFFRLARARLTEGGVLAMNLTAGTRLAPSVVATLRTVFEQVDTFGAGSQVVAFAYDGERPSRDALRERAAALQARFGFHHSLEHLVDLRMPLPVGPDPPVLTDDFAPADLYRADPAGGGN